jgi:hypothetical protein
MIRTLSSSGRRRRLVPRAFATFSLAVVGLVVGLLTTGASIAATSQDKTCEHEAADDLRLGSREQPPACGPGTWTGDQPITFRFRWLRCNSTGGNCIQIQSATGDDYTVRTSDVGKTLRVRVTASNDIGSSTALSARTDVVQAAAQQPASGRIQLPSGETSVAASSIPKDERMIVSQVRFEPNVLTNRTQPVTIRVRITDTRNFVIRDANVFVRSTPRVTTGGHEQTATDGWVTFQLQPLSTFQLKRGALQFFVKASRAGDPPLAGVAAYRLVQVIVRPQ